jgi:hypothetical protein
MLNEDKIDLSKYLRGQAGGRAATEEESKKAQPSRGEIPPSEKERFPDYHQRRTEREGRSNWSGGSMGGGTWAGRSRGEREQ